MKTKLVYVLTCAPDGTYIEQALMSVWSARHWNPDAHIVLLTDDKTSSLLHTGSSRGELLRYISEEVVSTFTEDKNMTYRSRWIKTKARELVSGDILFVDCDTICCRSLASVDDFQCNIGAVLESHLPISEFNKDLYQSIENNVQKVGWSLQTESLYFSSGVVYAKDVPESHKLYNLWHETWIKFVAQGINADQPTLGYANIKCGHLIERIPDSYNRILFTQTPGTCEAYILHISSFRNPSLLFEKQTLLYIRENGLKNEKLRELILHPCQSYLPFDNDILHSNIFERIKWTKDVAALEGGYLRAIIWMLRKRIHVLRHRKRIKDNVDRR